MPRLIDKAESACDNRFAHVGTFADETVSRTKAAPAGSDRLPAGFLFFIRLCGMSSPCGCLPAPTFPRRTAQPLPIRIGLFCRFLGKRKIRPALGARVIFSTASGNNRRRSSRYSENRFPFGKLIPLTPVGTK